MKRFTIILTALVSTHWLLFAEGPDKLDIFSNPKGWTGNQIENTLLATPAKPITLNIWPGPAPGETKPLPAEKDITTDESRKVAGKPVIRITNVATPQITVYKPGPGMDTGASVIIAPGGGHNILAYDLEGTEVAEWLNTMGVTGIVLKYRVPARDKEMRWKSAVQDAQRAVSLVRAEADRIGIDPNKIGLMGFSAGAQTAGLATLFNTRQYMPIDGYDQFSFKPDFVGIIYLGYAIHNEPGIDINANLPPFFMVVTHDDKDRAVTSAQLYIELKKVEVPSELHIYQSGGHGYGLRKTELPVTRWNEAMAAWMKQIGVLE